MELKTKFSVGDQIVAIKNHKCTEFVITLIFASVNDNKCCISYHGKTSDDQEFYADECDCFSSKEEFINQL
jgi:hypothetical protein